MSKRLNLDRLKVEGSTPDRHRPDRLRPARLRLGRLKREEEGGSEKNLIINL